MAERWAAVDARRQAAALAKLDRFRATVEALGLSAAARRFCSDDTLLRYLRARDGDERRAFAMLQESLRWRAKHIEPAAALHADGVPRCACCTADACAHCFFRVGRDCEGRSVVYSCAAKATNKVPIDNMLHMAFEMERLFAGNAAPGRLVWVIDFAGFGLRDLSPRMSATSVPMFAAHYPERMGQIVLLDPPAFFHGLYRAVLPMLDEVTRHKVVFVRGAAARRAYAEQMWASDPPLFAWMGEVARCRAAPGGFPERRLLQQLDDPTTVATLERAMGLPALPSGLSPPGAGARSPLQDEELEPVQRVRRVSMAVETGPTAIELLAKSVGMFISTAKYSAALLVALLLPVWGWSVAADEAATLEAPLGLICFALGLVYSLVYGGRTRRASQLSACKDV
jgi:hypothetical protein